MGVAVLWLPDPVVSLQPLALYVPLIVPSPPTGRAVELWDWDRWTKNDYVSTLRVPSEDMFIADSEAELVVPLPRLWHVRVVCSPSWMG